MLFINLIRCFMVTITSAIKVNTRDKIESTNISKDSGGIQFKENNPKLSKELLEALEGGQIIQEIKEGKRKGYNNVNDMMKVIMEDD